MKNGPRGTGVGRWGQRNAEEMFIQGRKLIGIERLRRARAKTVGDGSATQLLNQQAIPSRSSRSIQVGRLVFLHQAGLVRYFMIFKNISKIFYSFAL